MRVMVKGPAFTWTINRQPYINSLITVEKTQGCVICFKSS
ncbi:predicted protein [Sclerotinia sclerotiorum 1980 UF-70]|uniref:Uncharacterized protein n=1 Tax=Sclerotinia sclerotiorum (strain ATCC 18683 / 1980 / Ss-1) TaxID=665079 RepID=A7F113_SCLS1|nr:predicted protein [Sclerotinia sclerotiorum 1980 UF-70]EDN95405.1 predicted protein [Sclerotinia sclerotiorum 1980 UF-70]